jgi:hypothetical protein
MIKIAPDFEREIAEVELSKAELAREAQIELSTLHAIINPAAHPNRVGGIHPNTAWKLARSFAAHAGISQEAAYARLFVEEDRPNITPAPSLARATTRF